MDIYTYPVKLEERDGKYWALSEAFPGVLGIGDTAEEAKASILAAMKLYIEECIAENRPIPQPSTRQKEMVTITV
jgi:predicted RNase H-like HicB family nuclease